MKLIQFYRQSVQLDINPLETSRKLLSHNLNFTFEKVIYGKAPLWKCLSNGKWNTTEILCNLTESEDPENSEKLKLKKLLLKTCFILSGLRKSLNRAQRTELGDQGSADLLIYITWRKQFAANFKKFLCFCCILDFIIPIKVSLERLVFQAGSVCSEICQFSSFKRHSIRSQRLKKCWTIFNCYSYESAVLWAHTMTYGSYYMGLIRALFYRINSYGPINII